MHPTTRILLYLCSALALPGLSLFMLGLLAVGLLVWFPGRIAAVVRLLRRARWLFLLLGLGYAYGLPGPAALPVLADYSPSLPGLATGALQIVRLMLLFWLLEVLVLAMPTTRLMAGLHGLLSGLAWLGLPAERTTVRLALTLQAMETRTMGLHDLADLMRGHVGLEDAPNRLTIKLEPASVRDFAAVSVALLLLVPIWLV